MFAWGDAVVKLYRPGFLGHRTEVTVLSTLDGRGCAPRFPGAAHIDGTGGDCLAEGSQATERRVRGLADHSMFASTEWSGAGNDAVR